MKQRNIIPYLAASATLLMPFMAFAQQDRGILGVLGTIKSILSALVPILFGLALVYFIWSLVKYLGSSGDENAKAEARSQMLYGIIIIAVMLGVWGLAGILLATFVPDYNILPPFPKF